MEETKENIVFSTVDQASERYQLCRRTIIKIAKQADALYKFGGSLRLDSAKMDKYFMENHKQ